MPNLVVVSKFREGFIFANAKFREKTPSKNGKNHAIVKNF